MRIVIFCHSLRSDWNHGNAHFLRGVVCELQARGCSVRVFEPADAWSVINLVAEHGEQPLERFHRAYPTLSSATYDLDSLDLDEALAGADLVLVHEWNDHELVRRIGAHRHQRGEYQLLFHDTHHRSVTAPETMAAFDLTYYDGVLAFGDTVRDFYLDRGKVPHGWTWHEAADTRHFHPLPGIERSWDLVWVGNWGDDERSEAIEQFLLHPCATLGLRARVYGVRYPRWAVQALERAGIEYAGWLPNFEVPRVFASAHVTVHIPRRAYVDALPGVPTIRPFEALACAIPLVSAPWKDVELMFEPGRDLLIAHDGDEMVAHIQRVLGDPVLAASLSQHGRRTIQARHTCAHRVNELLAIHSELRAHSLSSGVTS